SSSAAVARLKPERDEKREQILKEAYAAFLDEGFAATSMSSIAARVGGSKATLYNYFSSKEELFAAVIDEKCRDFQGIFLEADVETADFRKVLTQLGERMLHMMLRDDSIATFRLITAESARFPELGRAFYGSGRKRGKQMLAELFTRAQKAGKLRLGNPQDMAVLFIEACKGELVLLKAWNVNPKPTEKEIKANIATAVTVFLAAYGA
ncbi:MAG TPA: TetR/AcrR family transcriptional regulator, partial [Rhizomicrobium sp.]|nr:TetR/AcrR family transcriptional regulator [Rhizomicrobium sp.]